MSVGQDGIAKLRFKNQTMKQGWMRVIDHYRTIIEQ